MPNVFELLDYKLTATYTYIGGVVCIIAAAMCFNLTRELHLAAKRNATKEGDEGLVTRDYFFLNSSLFLFAIVLSFKGFERLIALDIVTVLDVIRDTTLLLILITWSIHTRRERMKPQQNK